MVRPLRLARVAAQAEVLVVRRQVAGIVRRAILGAVAVVFALGVLVIAHIIAYLALRQYAQFGPIPAAGIVLGVDLAFAIVFGLLASGQVADPIGRNKPINRAIDALTRKLATDSRVQTVLLPLADGLTICRKLPPPGTEPRRGMDTRHLDRVWLK